jgi:hypothetical protein
MACEARLFGYDGDVDLHDAIPGGVSSRDGHAEHLDGVPALIGGIAIGEQLADITPSHGAENGVSHRVGDCVTVGMADEVTIEWDVDTAEPERTAISEAMGIVPDTESNGHAAERSSDPSPPSRSRFSDGQTAGAPVAITRQRALRA